ncbi:hypothetical protein NMD1_03160 [Novosphingobium sp. MD-1]|nr:hypothetical protein NMD1_03160 [Novosphingobium sp. MD-1]
MTSAFPAISAGLAIPHATRLRTLAYETPFVLSLSKDAHCAGLAR